MRKFVLKPKVELNILNSFGANLSTVVDQTLPQKTLTEYAWQNA